MIVNHVELEATIDTGCTNSVLATSVYNKFQVPPTFIKNKTLHSAGLNQTVNAMLVGPVRISIGHLLLFKNIYVGPIQDDFLLGLDLLFEIQGKIDVGKGTFYCRNKPIPVKQYNMVSKSPSYAKRTENEKIQPFSDGGASVNDSNGNSSSHSGLIHNCTLPNSAEYSLRENATKPVIRVISSSKNGENVPLECNSFLDADSPNLSTSHENMPDRLKTLLSSVHDSLSSSEIKQLAELLTEYSDIFAVDEYDVGTFTGVSHKIELSDTIPVKLNMRRTPWQLVDEEAELIAKMLKAGIIQPSTSSYASAPVMLRKKNGGLRYCLDYRLLNNKTLKDVYPLPLLSDCMDSLTGNLWFSKLDCNNAYHQIPVHPESKDKTAFRTRLGLFEFNKLPFGLCNAVSTYSRAIDLVLRGLNWKSVLTFIDDVCVLGTSVQDHLYNLREVFERFRAHGMKLKPSKCELFQKQMTFLGRQVSPQGVTITNHAIDTLKNWKEPATLKQLQSFLGFANFHRSFIKNFSDIAAPMFSVLKKKKPFFWGPEQSASFRSLCRELVSPAVLAMPTRHGRLYLDTDASSVAIGAELWQDQNGVKRVLSYGSFALSKPQMSYCTTRLELLAVVRFCLYFKNALLAQEFTVTTDHFALKWLLNFKNLEGQLARWVEILSQFNMTIEHRPGRHHLNADALSRRPNDDPCLVISDPKMLPCGGCKHCLKIHQKWLDFEAHVNDVVNLADRVKANFVCSNDTAPAVSPPLETKIKILSLTEMVQNDDIEILGFSREEIVKHQQDDHNLQFLRDFLLYGTIPSDQDVKFSHPASQFYFNNRNMFTLENGIIFQTEGVDRKLLLVPQSLVEEVLYICHDIPSSGHLGITKTKFRVNLNYTWYKKSKDISNYVISCKMCNISKSANRPARHPRVIDHAGFPLQKVHMDHLGPLTVTDNNNAYVLVIVDNFTKWVECLPLPDITAKNTAEAAVNHFFSRFGFPAQIVTDQGTVFESQLFTEMCKMLRVRKSRTTAYRPSANGQAEIKNRVLMAAIRCFVAKNQRDWDKYVPLVASALRSAVNRHTGYTPNELMLGRQLSTPADIVFPDDRLHESSPDQYIVALRKNMELAHNVARDYLKVQLKLTKRNNDSRVRIIHYTPGDVVYFLDRAPKNKLCPKWKGPCVITNVISPQTIQIQMKNNPKLKVVSHDFLKPCLDKIVPAWVIKARREITAGKPRRYCLCNKEDDGSFMVQCDPCKEWYHLNCVNITKTQAKTLQTYICPNCQNNVEV